MVADPHTKARDMIKKVGAERGGEHAVIGHPVKYSAAHTNINRGAPLIGQHSEEILAEFGFTKIEVEKLIKNNVVGVTEVEK